MRGAVMKKLTSKEKEQLLTMLDRQSTEQDKKRRRYRNHRAMVNSSRYAGDAVKRLEKLEKKHDQTQRYVAKRSELKVIHLTPGEKRELETKIQEAMPQR